MARYTGASCRLCRREGVKLFLKGERCYTNKCAVTRRAYAPGQHGQQKKKLSEYGSQLREKQKARRFYGVLESQFRKYFDIAATKKGVTGETLLRLLESRMDNVVYRMGLGSSRAEARQLVTHGHFLVNDKKVNIPSYLLKAGDVVQVRETSRGLEKIKEYVEKAGKSSMPKWLEFNANSYSTKVLSLPSREEIDTPVREHLIVELYSK